MKFIFSFALLVLISPHHLIAEQVKPQLTQQQHRLCGLQMLEVLFAIMAIGQIGLELPEEDDAALVAAFEEMELRSPDGVDPLGHLSEEQVENMMTTKVAIYEGMINGAIDKRAAIDIIMGQVTSSFIGCLR